jgi:hypothetical protein
MRSPRGPSPQRSLEQDRARSRSRSVRRSRPLSQTSRSISRSPSHGRRDRYRSRTRSPSRGRTRSRSRSRGGRRYHSKSDSRSPSPNQSPPRSSKVSAGAILRIVPSKIVRGMKNVLTFILLKDCGREIDQKCYGKSHPRDLWGLWRHRVPRPSNQQGL